MAAEMITRTRSRMVFWSERGAEDPYVCASLGFFERAPQSLFRSTLLTKGARLRKSTNVIRPEPNPATLGFERYGPVYNSYG
jgi:hypothetical protein